MSDQTPPPTVSTWNAWAVADAERRGLHALGPILEGLVSATTRLRATVWQPAADGPPSEPAAEGVISGGR